MNNSLRVPIRKIFHYHVPVNPNLKILIGNIVGNTGNTGNTGNIGNPPIYMFLCYQSI